MMRPVSVRKLYGPSYSQITDLQKKIRARAIETGRAYVYRDGETANEIAIASAELTGRGSLLAVYDRNVTTPMLREDLYGIEPDDVSYAELRRSVRA